MIARFGQNGKWASVAALALFLAVGCGTMTDGKKATPATGPVARVVELSVDGDIVTRSYDVRELIARPKNYEAPSFRGHPRSSSRPVGSLAGSESAMIQLIKFIQEAVEPHSWRDTGGSVGGMRAMEGQIIVSHRREAHAKIQSLLAQLHETRELQITTESRILWLDTATWKKVGNTIKLPGISADDARGAKTAAFLDRTQVNQLLNLCQESKDATTCSAPRITTFNGQRAYVSVATQQAYVADHKLINKGGKPALEPVVEVVESGLIFEVEATASADRKFVTANLRHEVAQLEKLETRPFEPLPEPLKDLKPRPTIQEPVLHVAECDTTISIPDGQTIVLGGQQIRRLSLSGEKGDPKAAEMGYLLILVKPTIGKAP